jgi:hypothetical protein
MKRLLTMLAVTTIAFSTQAADPEFKITGSFEPSEAKPGQTVTLKIKVDIEKGWHTYPTVQEDKAAAFQVNKIAFEPKNPVVFVENVVEPPNPTIKAEADLGITAMHTYPGGGVWERKAVVPPSTKPGDIEAKLKFTILICNDKNCLAPQKVDVAVPLKVKGDPVPVEDKFKSLVEKALKK